MEFIWKACHKHCPRANVVHQWTVTYRAQQQEKKPFGWTRDAWPNWPSAGAAADGCKWCFTRVMIITMDYARLDQCDAVRNDRIYTDDVLRMDGGWPHLLLACSTPVWCVYIYTIHEARAHSFHEWFNLWSSDDVMTNVPTVGCRTYYTYIRHGGDARRTPRIMVAPAIKRARRGGFNNFRYRFVFDIDWPCRAERSRTYHADIGNVCAPVHSWDDCR